MKNIILIISMVLIPFIALAGSIEEINKLMNKIKSNSKAYKIICYGDKNTVDNTLFYKHRLDLDNKEEYCKYLKTTIKQDIKDVLEMKHEK